MILNLHGCRVSRAHFIKDGASLFPWNLGCLSVSCHSQVFLYGQYILWTLWETRVLPTVWETRVQSLGWEDLEKEMATHSSILAWKIPYSPWGHKELDTTE